MTSMTPTSCRTHSVPFFAMFLHSNAVSGGLAHPVSRGGGGYVPGSTPTPTPYRGLTKAARKNPAVSPTGSALRQQPSAASGSPWPAHAAGPPSAGCALRSCSPSSRTAHATTSSFSCGVMVHVECTRRPRGRGHPVLYKTVVPCSGGKSFCKPLWYPVVHIPQAIACSGAHLFSRRSTMAMNRFRMSR